MTVGWAYVVGVLSTISVESVAVVVGALVVNLRKQQAAQRALEAAREKAGRAGKVVPYPQDWEREH